MVLSAVYGAAKRFYVALLLLLPQKHALTSVTSISFRSSALILFAVQELEERFVTRKSGVRFLRENLC